MLLLSQIRKKNCNIISYCCLSFLWSTHQYITCHLQITWWLDLRVVTETTTWLDREIFPFWRRTWRLWYRQSALRSAAGVASCTPEHKYVSLWNFLDQVLTQAGTMYYRPPWPGDPAALSPGSVWSGPERTGSSDEGWSVLPRNDNGGFTKSKRKTGMLCQQIIKSSIICVWSSQ